MRDLQVVIGEQVQTNLADKPGGTNRHAAFTRPGPAAVESAAQVANRGIGVLPGDEVATVVMG
ncbi:MAG TPA: hypothetical protein VME46_18735 [Acidimicrobiales bacterium]|nr:hypothetical protein [Acidimicrobiales bacterium]